MSKFNTKTTSKTVNLAGGDAYVQSDKYQLVSLLLTSFVADQFYRSENDTLDEVKNLINKISDKKFIGKSAVYARTKFGMRSISHVVAGELAKMVKGEEWTKRFYDAVVYRPDDITEILSYYMANYKKPVPNSLKKGLGNAFAKFDEYQIAKYRGEKHDLSLIDAVNLVHPKVNGEAGEAIKKLVAGTLRSRNTWESKLTEAGQKAKDDKDKDKKKAEAWAGLVKEKKIGYFALLRNLRNILEQAPEVVEKATELLVDRKLIKKSLVLPFRYSTAIDQIKDVSGVDTTNVRLVLKALNDAVDISVDNVPKLKGSTLVALDESGSMEGRPLDIGALFAAILIKSNNADLIKFSDGAKYKNLNPADSTLSLASEIKKDAEMSGTNFNAIFQEANKAYDRVIILSDMQGWMGDSYYGNGAPTRSFTEYKNRTGANPTVFSFDLQGYGSLQFPENNVYELAGFSDKVFDIIKLLETDRKALINEIEKIEL